MKLITFDELRNKLGGRARSSIYLDLESQKLVIDDLNGNTIVEKTNITNDQLFENQLSSFINNNNNLRNIDSLVKNLGIIDQCKEMNGLD